MTSRFDGIDHGALERRVPRAEIDRQLQTALAVRERLNRSGGVVLGDEVGSGKTFVTFAVLVEALRRSPWRGAVVCAPNVLVRNKWCRQMRDYFRACLPQAEADALVARILPMDRGFADDGSLDVARAGRAVERDSIVVATHTVFGGQVRKADQRSCLDAALRKLEVARGRRRATLFAACGLDPTVSGAESWAQQASLDVEILGPLERLIERYAAGERRAGSLLEEFKTAVKEVRTRVAANLFPDATLLVVDEAHAMRGHGAARTSLFGVADGRFSDLLLLTATPFQIERDELVRIVELFEHGTSGAARGKELEAQRVALKGGMDTFTDACERFRAAWSDLSPVQRREGTQALLRSDGPAPAPTVAAARDALRVAVRSRDELETVIRPFVVRSVVEPHHREHGAVEDRFRVPSSRVPLALVDRLLTQMLGAGDRTFISSALVNATSSWVSLFGSSVLGQRPGTAARSTRRVLETLREDNLLGPHPKVEQTVGLCLEAAERGEKTLVFVERIETGQHLAKRISEKLDVSSQLSTNSAQNQLRALQGRERPGWNILRENLLRSVYPKVYGHRPDVRQLRAAWREAWVRELWNDVDVDGRDRRYDIEHRFWEHVLFRRAAERRGPVDHVTGTLETLVRRVSDPAYITDEPSLRGRRQSRGFGVVAPSRRRTRAREPEFDVAAAVLAYRSPWESVAQHLETFAPDDRATFVETAASAFALSHLRAELARAISESDAARRFAVAERVLGAPKSRWQERFEVLARMAADARRTGDAPLGDLLTALEEGTTSLDRRAVFVQGGTGADTAQRVIQGFNTPLYPDVVVATKTLGEGLDLHRSCRRVIHHDLPWNPATLTQRTGRVDRVGSLNARRREEDPGGDHRIDVWLPYVPGAYDHVIHDRVLQRRTEFRTILGHRGDWDDVGSVAADEEEIRLPADAAEMLRVRLGPDELDDA